VSKWELVDMGSLNGTLVNGQQVADAVNSQPRHRSHPVALANGDVIALGSSQVLVQIGAGMKGSQLSIASAPFGVGVAVDAMTMRRGGKQLPMEDVCLCEWPLQGFQESSIGIFCVFDGHGGVAAAEAASRIMPQKLVEILAGEETWARVLRNGNASDVLRAAFHRTEEALDHEYEGCTATVLLLWPDANTGFYAQCANVGDSHCVISMGDQQVLMTEDHRLTSPSERLRLLQMGRQLKDGETRICGMNIARALGDKFLKEQDRAFSALPHISDVRRLTVESKAMVIIASDGLWDVLSPQRGVQLAAEAREGKSLEDGRKSTPQPAQGIAEYLLNKARNLRTKDNTSVIVLDFGSISKPSFHTL
jgi:protein phosphatase